MTAIHFRHALLPSGWARDVRVSVDADGTIGRVTPATPARPDDDCHAVAIPGLGNAHSHAFQRAMAGLSEQVPPGTPDSFWGWREVMYRFLAHLDPEQVGVIAALAYVEMLESGFTRVAEFHYLHHAPDGQPYREPARMAAALVDAARRTGIGLTLLPVHYQCADFGGAPALASQRRFVTTPDAYRSLRADCRALTAACPGAITGTALHSLRAVTPHGMRTVLEDAADAPVHIHVAEQTREVQDCLAWSGARPVAWLLDNAPVDPRWCLVHATHVDASEIAGLARSGAVAGLCPITEANLGDGVFPALDFAAAGGRYAVGSDSNVSISAAGELRLLEYGQRLVARQRNRMGAASGRPSPGRALLEQAAPGGAAACGVDAGRIAAGARADLVALDPQHPSLAGHCDDGWLDGWIFAAGDAAISAVWVGGRPVVTGGRHPLRDRLRQDYTACLWALVGR